MYMVPHSRPAPSAARIPSAAVPCGPPPVWRVVAYANKHAPDTIPAAPPSTFSHCFAPEFLSSLNSNQPQNKPTRLLVFHRGKAMERPTLRMANTVSVLATAHNMPARMAHTKRCFFSLRSSQIYPVPFNSMGTVQRATNTPATMPNEMIKGGNPAVTSLVGGSAAPSQAPAPKPQETPSECSERAESCVVESGAFAIALPHCRQQADAYDKNHYRQPEMAIGENCLPQRLFQRDLQCRFGDDAASGRAPELRRSSKPWRSEAQSQGKRTPSLAPTTPTTSQPLQLQSARPAHDNYDCRGYSCVRMVLMRLLDRLDSWKTNFGPSGTGQLERLLTAAARWRLGTPAEAIRFHETLLFLRAYPRSPRVARLADQILFR